MLRQVELRSRELRKMEDFYRKAGHGNYRKRKERLVPGKVTFPEGKSRGLTSGSPHLPFGGKQSPSLMLTQKFLTGGFWARLEDGQFTCGALVCRRGGGSPLRPVAFLRMHVPSTPISRGRWKLAWPCRGRGGGLRREALCGNVLALRLWRILLVFTFAQQILAQTLGLGLPRFVSHVPDGEAPEEGGQPSGPGGSVGSVLGAPGIA